MARIKTSELTDELFRGEQLFVYDTDNHVYVDTLLNNTKTDQRDNSWTFVDRFLDGQHESIMQNVWQTMNPNLNTPNNVVISELKFHGIDPNKILNVPALNHSIYRFEFFEIPSSDVKGVFVNGKLYPNLQSDVVDLRAKRVIEKATRWVNENGLSKKSKDRNMVSDISKNEFFNSSAKSGEEYLDWNRDFLLGSLRSQGKRSGLHLDEIGHLIDKKPRLEFSSINDQSLLATWVSDDSPDTQLNLWTKNLKMTLYDKLRSSIISGELDFIGIETLSDDFYTVALKPLLEPQRPGYGDFPYFSNDSDLEDTLSTLHQEFDDRFWFEPMFTSSELLKEALKAANLNPEGIQDDESKRSEHSSYISAANGVKYEVVLDGYEEISRMALMDEMLSQLQEATPERLLECNEMLSTKRNNQLVQEASEYFIKTADSLNKILQTNGIDLAQTNTIEQQKERSI